MPEAAKKPWYARTLRDSIDERRAAQGKAPTSRLLATFSGVLLYQDGIAYKGEKYALPATARVETAGEIRERVTATRLLAVGIFAFAFKKKKDARELYLTVEGNGWAFVVDVNPRKGREAREFAAKVSSTR